MVNLWMNLAKLRSQRKECVRSVEWMIVVLRCLHAVRSNFSLIFDILHGIRRWQCWTTLEKMRFYQIYIKLLLRHLPVVVWCWDFIWDSLCRCWTFKRYANCWNYRLKGENMRNEWDFHAKKINTTKNCENCGAASSALNSVGRFRFSAVDESQKNEHEHNVNFSTSSNFLSFYKISICISPSPSNLPRPP